MAWIIATKLEMTRVIKDDKFIPVTLLQVPALKVVGFKTLETDGYEAIIIWVLKDDAEAVLLEGKTTLSKNLFTTISEFPLSDADKERKVGDDILVWDIETGLKVVITWTSKGKWFTGAMKKHNFHGWPASHGSKFHRALGSIGNRKPTRTHKGKKMHGHHGNIVVSLRKVPVELINSDISVIGVRGGVPGARNSQVNLVF